MQAVVDLKENMIQLDCTPEELVDFVRRMQTSQTTPVQIQQAPQQAQGPVSRAQSPEPPLQLVPPEPKPQATSSFSKLYNQALGMNLKDYVARDPNKPTEEFVIDILSKCSAIETSQLPSEARISATVDAAKEMIRQGR